MRKKNQNQMPLTPTTVDHPHGMELKLISRILDSTPTINELAWQELTQNVENCGTGAEGMSAEQVVRCAIVKQMEDYSYDELAFHVIDSSCLGFRIYKKLIKPIITKLQQGISLND